MLALWQSAMKRQMTITTQKCCAACMTWAIYNDEARSVMYPPFGPVLFQLGPLSIHWYGLIMIVAIVVACWVASRYVTRAVDVRWDECRRSDAGSAASFRQLDAA